MWIKFYLDRITSAREQGLDVSDCNAEKKSSVNETTSSMNVTDETVTSRLRIVSH